LILIHSTWFGFVAYFELLDHQLRGFSSCSSLLNIVGTHLHRKYKGCLVIATGIDVDSGLYPLTFAVVESEPEDSWWWFLQCIYDLILSVHNNMTITFISDRRKGLSKALAKGWPSPHHHRYCLGHIRANCKFSFLKMLSCIIYCGQVVHYIH